jgi:hypothetical protein
MKIQLVIALAAFALVFAGCKKDDDDTDNGGNTPEEDYQPVTAGSTWQYNSSTLGLYTETALGTDNDTTIEGEKYSTLNNSEGGRRYVNKNGVIYKSYSYFEAIGESLKLTYLKDATVGTTWDDVINYDYNGFAVPVTFRYTIASRDGSKVVNSKTYENVIAVDIRISASSLLVGGDGTVATGQQFFAKGVGGILTTLDFNALGTTLTDSTYLVTADIKK